MASHDIIGLHLGLFYLRLSPLQLFHRASLKPVKSDKPDQKLEPRDLKILKLLAESDGKTVTRDELFDKFFVGDSDKEKALNTVIWKLRKPLGGEAIERERNVGYKLTLSVTPQCEVVDFSPFDEKKIAKHLKHTSYFAFPTPIDILEDQEAIEVLLRHPSGERRFAPPPEKKAMAIVEDILASDEKIRPSDPDYQR